MAHHALHRSFTALARAAQPAVLRHAAPARMTAGMSTFMRWSAVRSGCGSAAVIRPFSSKHKSSKSDGLDAQIEAWNEGLDPDTGAEDPQHGDGSDFDSDLDADPSRRNKRLHLRKALRPADQDKVLRQLQVDREPYEVVKEEERTAHWEVPQNLVEGLGAAPEGCRWIWWNEYRTAIPVPEKWTMYLAKGKVVGASATSLRLSPVAPPASPALTVEILQGVFSATLIKKTHEAVAEVLTGLVLTATGPTNPLPEGLQQQLEEAEKTGQPPKQEELAKMPDPLVIDTWAHALSPSVKAHGIEYEWEFDKLEDGVTSQHMRFLLTVVTNMPADVAWTVLYSCPSDAWDEVGSDLCDNVIIDM